eukprot:1137141-Pelagomonas_calceolata.AAC.5
MNYTISQLKAFELEHLLAAYAPTPSGASHVMALILATALVIVVNLLWKNLLKNLFNRSSSLGSTDKPDVARFILQQDYKDRGLGDADQADRRVSLSQPDF